MYRDPQETLVQPVRMHLLASGKYSLIFSPMLVILLVTGCDNHGVVKGRVSHCVPACQVDQVCDNTRLECVCNNSCTVSGAICDPSGSGQIGTCSVNAATGCYSIGGLAPCPTAGQICAVGSSACAAPVS